MTKILYGKPLANEILDKVKYEIDLRKRLNPDLCIKLAILKTVNTDDNIAYENSIRRVADKIGITCVTHVFEPFQYPSEEVMNSIINDETINGVIALRPIAKPSPGNSAIHSILHSLYNYDIDGTSELTPYQQIAYKSNNFFIPCTAEACVRLLDYYNIDYVGKHVVVLGRSESIGMPIALEFLRKDATVTICHSKTENLPNITKQADIIISAIGKPEFITSEYVRSGQTIIDVGINTNSDGELCGDVKFNDVVDIVDAITPVPNGIGPITTAILLEHVKIAHSQFVHRTMMNNCPYHNGKEPTEEDMKDE